MSETSQESRDATRSRWVSPDEYFEELRNAISWVHSSNTLRKHGALLAEQPWPRIGRFEARKWMGSGGFGVVVVAHDPDLDRFVALKLCPGVRKKAEEAFKQEAQLVANLSHPNIITIFEFGRHGDDFYYVMEYFDGGDINWMLERKDPSRATIVETYCLAGEGIAAAHERPRPIVHGDIKPSNVLVSDDGARVCVADFGLARVIGETDGGARPGSSSYLTGTLDYLAPELLLGERPTALSDQWAFCVSVWRSLFGVHPFAQGHDADTALAAILGGLDVPRLSAGRTADVVKALRRGLSIDPRERYPDMRALVLALRSAMAIVPGVPARGRGWVFPLVGVVALVVGLVVGAWGHRRGSSPVAKAPQLEIDGLAVVSGKIDKLQLGMQKLEEANRILDAEVVTAADTQRAYDLWHESQPLVMPLAPRFFALQSLELAKRLSDHEPGQSRTAWIAVDAATAYKNAKDLALAAEAACEAARVARLAGDGGLAEEQAANAAEFDPDHPCEDATN